MEQVKYRNEIKYLCSENQLALIENRIKTLCRLDSHAGADGTYLVSSLYLDDYDKSCYLENENGVDPREKFRIRIYNRNLDNIVLECKQKRAGMTLKDSCPLSYEQYIDVVDGRPFSWAGDKDPLFNRLYLQWQTRLLRPEVIVEYERKAYVYQTGNVRITFDRNISASAQTSRFGMETLRHPVMPAGRHILEIKYDELIPDYIYNAVGIEKLQHTAFSKYYYSRKIIS